MKAELIKKRIEELCPDADILILKKFPIKDILQLKNEYPLLDDYVIEEDKINLSNINNIKLLDLLIHADKRKYLLTYESFQDLTESVRNLAFLKKVFCVITNNLLAHFENPTSAEIPDFDNNDFQEDFSSNSLYSKHYAFCLHEGNKEYIQYVGHQIDVSDECLEYNLYDPINIEPLSALPKGTYPFLSADNGTLDELLEKIYFNKSFSESNFLVEDNYATKSRFGILFHLTRDLQLPLNFFVADNNNKVIIREDLYTIMKKTWGYESFRDLIMYKDLRKDKSINKLSQGEVVETVIRKSEAALQDRKDDFGNVLLTSPTGAGKSLLFQLAAIYLAQQYQALTIIVSPLVALMNDQVENLVGNYQGVATLNGNIPVTQKEDTLDLIRQGKINILYLAPELLLSYSLSSFIGKRRLGLFVVDEAHTVTTWGRDFRIDYWFLGDYLRQSQRSLGYKFPIFALTATAVWDPTGKNDMVYDTIKSLKMDPCISYIGVVRREDITFDIQLSKISTNYEKERNHLTSQTIHYAVNKGYKTIVYFPYKSTLNKVLNMSEMNDISSKVTEYHASLLPAEKNINAEGFKNGEKMVMCATKAYGMGIDVSDIKMVYHHAPTGCLSDYVQEIGRVARDPRITGIAKIDFSEYDFRFTRTLHGLSAIKSYQLRAVLQKLMALFSMKGEKRNMLITSQDFEYIFPGRNIDYDQKIKSCLLLISNDLMNKLHFNSIIVRPKNLFSKAYVKISKYQQKKFENIYKKYINLLDEEQCIYKVDIDLLWNKHFSQYSFPNFKRLFVNGDIFKDFNITIVNKLEISLNVRSVDIGREKLDEFFNLAHKFLNKMSVEHRQLHCKDIYKELKGIFSAIQIETFIETFKMVYATNGGITDCNYCRYDTLKDLFQLSNHGYESLQSLYLQIYDKYIKGSHEIIFSLPISQEIKLVELLNSLNIANYERLSGDKPSIFVRINNPTYLNDLVRKGNYHNDILQNIYDKYEFSEWVYTYFFTQRMSNHQRWDFIEAYFLGAGRKELEALGKTYYDN